MHMHQPVPKLTYSIGRVVVYDGLVNINGGIVAVFGGVLFVIGEGLGGSYCLITYCLVVVLDRVVGYCLVVVGCGLVDLWFCGLFL